MLALGELVWFNITKNILVLNVLCWISNIKKILVLSKLAVFNITKNILVLNVFVELVTSRKC